MTIRIKKIKPVIKNGYRMHLIVLANTKRELTNYRRKNRHKYKQIFYGSPRKDKKGYYALACKY